MQEVMLSRVRELAQEARGYVDRIYLHWSAGHYGQFFEDYHINIDFDGKVYISTDDFTEKKAHTWMRNSRSIGVAVACCAFGTTNDLGEEPPTLLQIESLAQVVAELCKGLEIPCIYDYVRTHGEQADEEDEPYGQNTTCERWDLAILSNGDEWGSGGNIIRGKANFYINKGGE
jgi:hypothetical protein